MVKKYPLRRPGIEPGSQEWESCMIPLHQRRNLSLVWSPHEPATADLRFHKQLIHFGGKFHCLTDQVGYLVTETTTARLAQSVEHETLNLRVVGSSPTLGASFYVL